MENSSIIQKFFHIVMEIKIFCSECNVSSKNIKYSEYLNFDLEKVNNEKLLLNEILFKKKEEKKKQNVLSVIKM